MRMGRRETLSLVGCAVSGCVGAVPARSDPGAEVTVACGTTVYDTGLADALAGAVRDAEGVEVRTLPRGTGSALRIARSGDADAVFVHHPEAERTFVDDGPGVDRREVMFNDFLLAGPPGDPADVASAENVTAALRRIADSEVSFLSRGDDSGTHARELRLWEASNVHPTGEWYGESGSGMGETLRVASTTGAYVLADRGSYRTLRDDVDLDPLFAGTIDRPAERLENVYSVIRVDPTDRRSVAAEAAVTYAEFLTGRAGQRLIETYRPNGDRLFVPIRQRDT